MKKRILKFAALLCALTLTTAPAVAESMVSTTLIMRVSHMTQNAVVNAGEDLSMEVSFDGVTPSSYQWYFNDAPIAGANQRVYSIVNAKAEDTGIYRLDAMDENGKLLVSMDVSARVLEPDVPKSGDGSLPVEAAMGVVGASALGLMLTMRRKVNG